MIKVLTIRIKYNMDKNTFYGKAVQKHTNRKD